MRTLDPIRRDKLLSIFEKTTTQLESIDKQWFSFDHSSFHNSRFCSEEERLEKLNLCNNNKNRLEDTLILMTAKGYNMLIVSNDRKCPFKTAQKNGYEVIFLEKFLHQF